MKTIIYFGGTFSGKKYEELVNIRKNLIFRLELTGSKILDPLRDKQPLKDKEDIKMDEYHLEAELRPNSIVHKDLNDIRKSDIVILYMTSPSIGSSCEMMFAHLHNKIIIIYSDNSIVYNHPWIQSLATEIVNTEDDLISSLSFYL